MMIKQELQRSQAKLQYRPSEDKLFNLGWQIQRESFRTGKYFPWSLPLSETWNFLGHYYNYSLKDKKT